MTGIWITTGWLVYKSDLVSWRRRRRRKMSNLQVKRRPGAESDYDCCCENWRERPKGCCYCYYYKCLLLLLHWAADYLWQRSGPCSQRVVFDKHRFPKAERRGHHTSRECPVPSCGNASQLMLLLGDHPWTRVHRPRLGAPWPWKAMEIQEKIRETARKYYCHYFPLWLVQSNSELQSDCRLNKKKRLYGKKLHKKQTDLCWDTPMQNFSFIGQLSNIP